MISEDEKRSWVEIDLNVIRKNYRIYKSFLGSSSEIMAVVKADAYGHGDIKVSKALNTEGADLFAVSNIIEAIGLRENGITGEILILGYTPLKSAKKIKKYDLTQAILSEEYAESLLKEADNNTKVQFAIDTGMRRIGLNADDPDNCGNIIRKYYDSFYVTGIFTHLCVADSTSESNVAYTKEQIEKFENVSSTVYDLDIPYRHCLNSAAGIYADCKYEDINKIVRLGIILYGLKPDYSNVLPDNIEPALQWKSVVSMIKEIHKGDSVGYGRTFVASKDMITATVPTGYADGFNRLLSNKGFVLVGGKKAPIIGRVCMDQFMIDITEVPDVQFGDEVVLIGKQSGITYTADDMAQTIGTIGYEIVCDISKRVPRVYIDE